MALFHVVASSPGRVRRSRRVEVVDLHQHAAVFGLEGSVISLRRTAGVGVRRKALTAIAFLIITNREVTGDEINLFPIVMDKRLGRENTGSETQ